MVDNKSRVPAIKYVDDLDNTFRAELEHMNVATAVTIDEAKK